MTSRSSRTSSSPPSRGTSGRARTVPARPGAGGSASKGTGRPSQGSTPSVSRGRSGSSSRSPGSRVQGPGSSPSSVPWFPIALFGLFAVGCFASRSSPSSSSSSTERKRTLSFSFQVDGDGELYPLAKTAADYWSKKTGATITVTPDGEIPILLVEQLSSDCGESPEPRGCSIVGESPREGWIEILASTPPAFRHGVILHEMGHHLRGSLEHLSSPPNAVMTLPVESGPYPTTLTAEDVAFVCAGRLECPPPKTP